MQDERALPINLRVGGGGGWGGGGYPLMYMKVRERSPTSVRGIPGEKLPPPPIYLIPTEYGKRIPIPGTVPTVPNGQRLKDK